MCSTNNSQQLTSLVAEPSLDCCNCFNFLAAENCNDDPNSTLSAIESRFGGESSSDCCNNVSTIVITESYARDIDVSSITKIYFTQEELQTESIAEKIGAGEYIIPHFVFENNVCISTIFVRPLSPIAPDSNNMLNVSIYRRYSSPSSFTSELYELKTSFSVNLVQQELLNNTAAGSPNEQVCVETGDALGFTIPSTADFSLGSLNDRSDFFTHNISAALFEQPCQQLDGFFEVAPLVGFGYLNLYVPLITVEFGTL